MKSIAELACEVQTLVRFSKVLPESINYDESKVPDYTLPDLLTLNDGTKVKDADIWWKRRRPEILRMFEEYAYGKVPGKLDNRSVETAPDCF